MLELEHGFRILDVAVRLEPNAAAVATHGRDVGPDRLEREMQQAGVVRALVSPGQRPEGRSYLRANNAVARLSVDRPFLAVARINGPRDPEDGPASRLRNLAASRRDHHTSPSDAEQYAYDDRFHGFVLEPGHDGLPDGETLDVLEAVELPVFVHAGADFPPVAVEETLLGRSFPVVLVSFGGHPLSRPLMSRAVDLLDDYDRLYLDTSRVRYRTILERGLVEHPDRILFGSGAPEIHPSVGVMEILTLDVPENAMRRVFDKNPSRVVEGLAP